MVAQGNRDASKLFDDAVINPVTKHGWSKQHAAYNRIAKKALDRFCESTQANTKEVTKDVAQEFFDYLRANPQIARFNAQIRSGEPLTMPDEEDPELNPSTSATEPPVAEPHIVEPMIEPPFLEPLIIP